MPIHRMNDDILQEMFIRFGKEMCDDDFMPKLVFGDDRGFIEAVRVNIPRDKHHALYPHYYRLTPKAITYLERLNE